MKNEEEGLSYVEAQQFILDHLRKLGIQQMTFDWNDMALILKEYSKGAARYALQKDKTIIELATKLANCFDMNDQILWDAFRAGKGDNDFYEDFLVWRRSYSNIHSKQVSPSLPLIEKK